MQVDDDAHCFVCGNLNEHGLQAKFDVDVEQQSSQCRIVLPGGFQGWKDVVHGGILATLLDEACIYACRSVTPNSVTAELTVRYKKPVTVGDELVVSARIVEQKKRIFQLAASIEVAGVVHAEAEARVFKVK